jgi:ATP-dependent Lon protease
VLVRIEEKVAAPSKKGPRHGVNRGQGFNSVGGSFARHAKDGVNIMKGYMASGEFSRGKDSIRAEGGIVLVGNLDVDLDQAQRVGHLLAPLPPDMREDPAFMDRLHAYAPGWDFPKLDPRRHLTDHFGLVSDFLSESFTRLRATSRVGILDGRVHFGGALSGRDIEAVRKTVSGLLCPNPSASVPDADLEWIVRLALESRRRVKEQQRRVFKSEFRNTHFSYTLGADGIETFVATPELRSDQAIESDPLPPGQVWAISSGSAQNGAGLYRIEVSHQPGSGVRRRAVWWEIAIREPRNSRLSMARPFAIASPSVAPLHRAQ